MKPETAGTYLAQPVGASLLHPGSRAGAWPLQQSVHWVLRIGSAMCFIGHGVFGILTKPAWVAYFGVLGIPADAAVALMPVVGAVDITLGLAVLLSPRPAFLLYMAVWGLWTALLRPLAGESLWEALERAGNYGVPFALLLLAGVPAARRGWFAPVQAGNDFRGRMRQIAVVLQATTALLLAGHGALGALTGSPLLTGHYAAIGLPPGTGVIVGWAELALAAAVLLHPGVFLLLLAAIWKLAAELLFPLSGAPIWEFIERGGSYAAPLAAALLTLAAGRPAIPPRGVR